MFDLGEEKDRNPSLEQGKRSCKFRREKRDPARVERKKRCLQEKKRADALGGCRYRENDSFSGKRRGELEGRFRRDLGGEKRVA